MALNILRSIFHLARILYVRPETSGRTLLCFILSRICYILFVKERVYNSPLERNDYLSCHITCTVKQSPIYDRVSRNHRYFKKESINFSPYYKKKSYL